MLDYRPTPAWESTLQIMAEINTLNLEAPCNATRQMMDHLVREGIPISRDRLRNLMRHMRLRAIDQKPRTKSLEIHPGVSPAWLTSIMLSAVDQVWTTEFTTILLQKGFLVLVTIVDLFSRNGLS